MRSHIYDGEWYRPKPMRGHREICCDCGLVHVTDFKIIKGEIHIRSYRDDKLTAKERARLRRQGRGTAGVARARQRRGR